MNTPVPTGDVLGVDLSLVPPHHRRRHAAIAASLPQLFRLARSGRAAGKRDIRVVDAAAHSWPGTLAQALREPVRGVLISIPAAVDAASVAALAARAESIRCPVVVATPVPYDATIQEGTSWIRADEPSFADSIVTTGAPDGSTARSAGAALGAGLLLQLAAVRTIIGPPAELTMNYETGYAYSATGHHGNITMMLAGLVSTAPAAALRVDVVGARTRHTISLADPFAAIPATFLSAGGSGTRRLPLSYDSGMRAAWRNLHASVTGAQPVRYGLRELLADLAIARLRTASL